MEFYSEDMINFWYLAINMKYQCADITNRDENSIFDV